MTFSIKKAQALLAALLVFVLVASSSLALAQKDNIPLQLLVAQTKKLEKASNLKGGGGGGGGGGGKVLPIRSKNDDESDRQQRRLALSTAVHYPNPCLDLPANRVPEFNSTNPANDGWSLALPAADFAESPNLPLSFSFAFLGQRYSALIVDNNGYLIFLGSVPHNLDVFVSDVDTRGGTNTNGGYVWRKAIGTHKYAVAWDNVGYHNQQTDKLNTFQVIISDGTDASMGLGNNVCYCYQDMQWTDIYGFVGVDMEGPGLVPFGWFAQTGAAYDGGYGKDDGFDYLDNKSICFKASGKNMNIPPVAVNVPEKNRVDLACGQSLNNLTIFFLAPEDTQSVSLTTSGASAGLTVNILQQPNQATATATINWTPTAAAMVNVTLTASNGIESTTVNLTFTSPGPCPCQGTTITAEIWNPTTDKFVKALVNGTKYCLKKYNLRAVLPCQTAQSVLMEIWNMDTGIRFKSHADRTPPYFLFGDKINATGYVDVLSNVKMLPNGNYSLRINATNPNSFAEIRFRQYCS